MQPQYQRPPRSDRRKTRPHWCISYINSKGRYSVRIPLPDGKGRKYIGCAPSIPEAERMRDAGFMKIWGRIPTPDEC